MRGFLDCSEADGTPSNTVNRQPVIEKMESRNELQNLNPWVLLSYQKVLANFVPAGYLLSSSAFGRDVKGNKTK